MPVDKKDIDRLVAVLVQDKEIYEIVYDTERQLKDVNAQQPSVNRKLVSAVVINRILLGIPSPGEKGDMMEFLKQVFFGILEAGRKKYSQAQGEEYKQ